MHTKVKALLVAGIAGSFCLDAKALFGISEKGAVVANFDNQQSTLIILPKANGSRVDILKASDLSINDRLFIGSFFDAQMTLSTDCPLVLQGSIEVIIPTGYATVQQAAEETTLTPIAGHYFAIALNNTADHRLKMIVRSEQGLSPLASGLGLPPRPDTPDTNVSVSPKQDINVPLTKLEAKLGPISGTIPVNSADKSFGWHSLDLRFIITWGMVLSILRIISRTKFIVSIRCKINNYRNTRRMLAMEVELAKMGSMLFKAHRGLDSILEIIETQNHGFTAAFKKQPLPASVR